MVCVLLFQTAIVIATIFLLSQGKVVYFEKSDPPLVVTDPGWLIQVIQDIEQKARDTAGRDVRCLAPDTRLWPDRTLLKSGLKTVDHDKVWSYL